MWVPKPEDVEVTLKITATVGEWVEVRESLKDKWPDWRFSNVIGRAIAKVQDQINEQEEDVRA